MKRIVVLVGSYLLLTLIPATAVAEKTYPTKHKENLVNIPRHTDEANDLMRNEVLLTAFSNLSTGTSSRLGLNGNDGTSFYITGGYNYLLPQLNWLQVGGAIGLEAIPGSTAFEITVGPTVNFPFDWDIRNAFFADGYLGIYYTSAGTVTVNSNGNVSTSSTAFMFGFDVGKRFKLLDNITYHPSVGIVKSIGNVQFVLNFISFSAVF